ncbi:MAG: low molecular weight protein-tyrosine-phosphatase [Acidimicrobiales bacterium]
MTAREPVTDPVSDPVRILFVCLGNICRSPTAEAVMRHHVDRTGLTGRIEVDSAGTGGWHVGEPPDQRAQAEARRRGIAMTSRARQFHPGDFEWFDLILAMDRQNLTDLHDLACTPAQRSKIRLLREFDPAHNGDLEVPDPYYGGSGGFATVFDQIEAACLGLLDHLRGAHLAAR